MLKQAHAARMWRLVARWRASEESGASFARRHGATVDVLVLVPEGD